MEPLQSPTADAVKPSQNRTIQNHLGEDVTVTNTDSLLLLCCLVSGLIDSTIYNGRNLSVMVMHASSDARTIDQPTAPSYRCKLVSRSIPLVPRMLWVSARGSLGHRTNKPYGWAKSLVSIVCFILGAFVFSRFCRYLNPMRRGTLVSSFLIQSTFILVTAAIIEAGVVDGSSPKVAQDIDWRQVIPIALLSFQSAGQMVGSRILNMSEIPTVVVTSVLCDFASDPRLTDPLRANAKRNRRLLGFFGILVGAVAGGWISNSAGQIQSVLWLAGGIKLLVTVSWMLWPRNQIMAV
ncbi:hypothetical protein MMC07_006666 [Pseudocyphellaria aurata]|nr:hypothetical protein [Pseudocyphellaria aurata]